MLALGRFGEGAERHGGRRLAVGEDTGPVAGCGARRGARPVVVRVGVETRWRQDEEEEKTRGETKVGDDGKETKKRRRLVIWPR